MISILIPAYNVLVTELVHSLKKQFTLLNKRGEIIVIDDASLPGYRQINEEINQLPNVKYQYLTQNTGRAKVREKLAALAIYDWLLFIDGDCVVQNDNFLSNYINELNNNNKVITGGRLYQHHPPENCSLRLHWKYGKKRENIFANRTGFMTNNFLIRKDLYDQLPLTSHWNQYGHEDTAMGIELEKMDINIITINNPVIHTQIETSEVFLKKSEQALQNIPLLVQQYGSDIVAKHIKIYKWYLIIQQLRIGGIIEKIYYFLQNHIQKNLASCYPSLFSFDFYRIVYLFKAVMF
jgi:glycosyltransferase involved in cell wall biosynthesis